MKKVSFYVCLICLGLLIVLGTRTYQSQAGKVFGTSAEMVKSIERLLEINPNWAMDAEPFGVWGPYWCGHLTKGKANMIHFAKDPSKDDADIILLVQAEPFIEDAGLKTDVFPQLTEKPFGPGLTSGQWYYIPKLKLLVLPLKVEDAGMGGSIEPCVLPKT